MEAGRENRYPEQVGGKDKTMANKKGEKMYVLLYHVICPLNASVVQ